MHRQRQPVVRANDPRKTRDSTKMVQLKSLVFDLAQYQRIEMICTFRPKLDAALRMNPTVNYSTGRRKFLCVRQANQIKRYVIYLSNNIQALRLQLERREKSAMRTKRITNFNL